MTASRRGDQNLQNTPIALDAYSGTTLTRYNVQSIQDLTKLDPSLDIQQKGATQQQIVIRGISSSVGSTTGIYLDEAPLVGGFDANNFGDGTPGLRLHDIDHIEVLKGPQGTLFGAGSMDGTLRAITNKPKLDRYEASLEGTGAGVEGGNAYYDGDGMVNIPVIKDVLGIRLVGWGEDGGGYIDQTIAGVTRHNVNNEHLEGGRFEVLFKPIDHLSILGTYNYQDVKVDGSQNWTPYTGNVTIPDGPEVGPFQPYNNMSFSQEPYRSQYRLYTVTAQYDLKFGSVVATGSHGTTSQIQPYDTSPSSCTVDFCEGSPLFPASYVPDTVFTDTTAELRFSSKFSGPFQLVAGAYYERDMTRESGSVLIASKDGSLPCETYDECLVDGLTGPNFNTRVAYAEDYHFNVDQYALYAQGDYKLPYNLSFTFGIRYFSANLHELQITEQNIFPTETPYGLDGGYVSGDVTTPYPDGFGGSHDTQTTYNISLLWRYRPNISFYVRAASGFRIGGINGSSTIGAEEGINVPPSYAPDSLWDYEGGMKAYLFDRKAYVDLSIFHIDWSDEQINAEAGGIIPYTLNVAETSTTGFELSANDKPIKGLTLTGSITYVDAELAQDLPPSVVDSATPGRSGDRVPLVPHVTFAGQAEYDHPLTATIDGYLQGDVDYRSNTFTAFRPSTAAEIAAYGNDYDTELPSYTLLNLRTGIRVSHLDLSLFCNNVTNTVAYEGAAIRQDAIRIFSAQPRTIGLHASYTF